MSSYLQPEHYNIAEQNGISKELLEKRIFYYGLTAEEACNKPVDTRCHKTGRWGRWKEKAVVSYKTFSSRINFLGWDEERAAMTPRMSRKQRAKLGATSRKSKLTEAQYATAAKNGISRGCASNRVNALKWSIERAITQPPRKTNRSQYLN